MEIKSTTLKFTLLLVLLIVLFIEGQCQFKVFPFERYGAVKGGQVDNKKALLKAWDDACKFKGGSKLVISSGVYLVSPITLAGPCNGPIEFQNSGTLQAPLGLRGESWIEFEYIDEFTLSGGGTFDGHGPPKQAGPNLPILLRFSFVTNSKAHNVKLINSQSTHFNLFGCNNTVLDKIMVSSPEDSPNTDGIKIGVSNGIKISNSFIASGDDCVALLTGSKNISVVNVDCGPGHGISIGSIGGTSNEDVDNIVVRNCRLVGTMNGLRIKTKATNMLGIVSNVQYEDISMTNVGNPIIFDQNYCPSGSCNKGASRVQISDVKFKNIHGTSKTTVAVNLQCTENNPCQKIELTDININHQDKKSYTTSNCSYVNGHAYGIQIPKPCISM